MVSYGEKIIVNEYIIDSESDEVVSVISGDERDEVNRLIAMRNESTASYIKDILNYKINHILKRD